VRGDTGGDLLQVYLAEVARHPLLSRADEVELSARIHAAAAARRELVGDRELDDAVDAELEAVVQRGDEARDRFVRANLRLVVFIARKHAVPGVSRLDLIQDGNLGLLRAVEKFDGRKGFAFSTYATWWIRQVITRGMARGEAVRLPAPVTHAIRRLQHTRARLESTLGRTVTNAEIADDADESLGRVTQLMLFANPTLSLSSPEGEGHSSLGEMVEDQTAANPCDAAVVAALPDEIERVLRHLTDSERSVLVLRYGLRSREPHSVEQAGAALRLSGSRVQQIEQRALRKLRQPTPRLELASL